MINAHSTTRPSAFQSIHSVCGVHSMPAILPEGLDVTPALAAERQAHAVVREREDFGRFLAEAGLAHDQVQAATHNETDQIPMPAGFDHLTVQPSAIHGQGLFTSREIHPGEVIGPVRISDMRTPLGRYPNHSPWPNVAFRRREGHDLEAVALCRIPAGAELVNDYRQALALLGAEPNVGEVQKTRKLRVRQDMNDKVTVLERIVLQAPQTDLQTRHELSGQVYARTIFIPAGTILTGAAHRKDHVNIMHGDITVSTDEGMRRLSGYLVLPTKAGMKRVGLAHADTWWTTVLQTENTEIEAIEDEMTDESANLQTRTLNLAANSAAQLEV